MDSVPGALATAAAVTPSVTVTPLPTVVNVFEPPTILLGGYGSTPFHRWWNETPTGVSVLKFGSSYQQYQSPTDDDVRGADIAYLGGRVYEVSDDEAAALTAAGYGANLSTRQVPYFTPVMGGVDTSGGLPLINIASISPPPAVAFAVANPPVTSPQAIVAKPATVLAGAAGASAFAVAPSSVSAGTTTTANVQAAPATASGSGAAPVVTGVISIPRTVTAVPATASAVAPVPQVAAYSNAYPGSYTPTYGGTGVSYLSTSGTQLISSGRQYRFTGWDSYVMRDAGGTPAQTMTDSQRDAFFAGLAPSSIVRVWAFPPRVNTYTNDQVLAEQDKIVASAKNYGHRLIFTLADWYGNANDGTGSKDATWLTNQTYNGTYRDWLDIIVPRYASEPTVAVWDLLNEPRVPSNSADLKTFVDSMGARIKGYAPDTLVMCGILTPSISCGSTANYQTVMSSAYIDLVTYHDYYEQGGVDSNFTAVRGVAVALNKPMVVDEVGVWASSNPTVYTTTSPAGYAPVTYDVQGSTLQAKFNAYKTYPEVAGFCVWSEMEAGINDPAYEPPPGTAARTVVHNFSWS